MKQLFYIVTFSVAALILILLTPSAFAQDVPAEATAIATTAPATSSDEASVEFSLPPLNEEYVWIYGVFFALVAVIVVLVGRLYGSVPLSALPSLFAFAKGIATVVPGKADDKAVNWLETLLKPNLDPTQWPSLIQDLVAEKVISPMIADEAIATIAAQKLNPYQAYAQAEALAHHFRARMTVPIAQEGAGAQAVSREGFRPNRDA